MLPASARLRRRAEFTATVRRGRRGRSRLVTVHLDPGHQDGQDGQDVDTGRVDTGRVDTGRVDTAECDAAPRVGFAVSRAVGPAVVRNRVRRRLRHVMSTRVSTLPPGSRLVVRALPDAATASSAALAGALDRALIPLLAAGESS